jgi:glucokinase
MVDGRILRGADDIAGAIGWMALTRPWIPQYESCGCFEYHASGTGIAEMVREMAEKERFTFRGTEGRDPGQLTAADVFTAFQQGDPHAQEIIRCCIEFWGKASANLVSLFNPEKIIFGGGVFGPAAQFLGDIYAEAVRWAQPVSIRKVQFVASRCGQDAGLFGAAFLALNNDKDI